MQDRGIALLVEGRPEIVARSGADGAHLNGIAALGAALETLKPDRIAGVGGLPTRHDAMVAAKSGADYVLFGSAEEATNLERVAWCAEVLELPCVAFARSEAESRTAGRSRRRLHRARLHLARADPRGRTTDSGGATHAPAGGSVVKRIIITLGAVLLAFDAHAQTSRTVSPPAPKPAATYDSAFGAYQRGYFLTAFKEASELAAKERSPIADATYPSFRRRPWRRPRRRQGGGILPARCCAQRSARPCLRSPYSASQGRGGSRDEKAGAALFGAGRQAR